MKIMGARGQRPCAPHWVATTRVLRYLRRRLTQSRAPRNYLLAFCQAARRPARPGPGWISSFFVQRTTSSLSAPDEVDQGDRLMRKALPSLLVAGLSLAFAPAPLPRPPKPAAAQDDMKQIQGTWEFVSRTYSGQPAPA